MGRKKLKSPKVVWPLRIDPKLLFNLRRKYGRKLPGMVQKYMERL